jgi:hypothetical protein
MSIRSSQARRAFRAFASVPVCASLFQDGWNLHPVDVYAREVLAGLHLSVMRVSTRSKLVHLSSLGSVTELVVEGSYSAEELGAYLPTQGVKGIWLEGNEKLASLDFLRMRAHLQVLGVPVGSLTGEQLGQLGGATELRSLALAGTPLDGWSDLTPLPAVRSLDVASDDPGWVARLADWTGLEELGVSGQEQAVPEVLRAVSRTPRIHRVVMRLTSLNALVACTPVPHVRNLYLHTLRDYADVAQLRRVFPELETLHLQLGFPATRGNNPLDLTPLLTFPGLRVTLTGISRTGTNVVGAEKFGDRLSDQVHYTS